VVPLSNGVVNVLKAQSERTGRLFKHMETAAAHNALQHLCRNEKG
jgi:hypothetical protein